MEYIVMPSTKPCIDSKTESRLTSQFEELNRAFFSGAVHISGVRLKNFAKAKDCLLFACYIDDVVGDSWVEVNRQLLRPAILTTFPWFMETVLYHELCHAYLVQNVFPRRLGMGHDLLSHGPEFRKLEALHPMSTDREDAAIRVARHIMEV
jgi:hypothetical protein